MAVPGIDVVIGAHSHTELHEPIIVNGRTPVVQTGKYGENLGELVITLDKGKLTVESYQLHPIDDTIAGDRLIEDEIDKFNAHRGRGARNNWQRSRRNRLELLSAKPQYRC